MKKWIVEIGPSPWPLIGPVPNLDLELAIEWKSACTHKYGEFEHAIKIRPLCAKGNQSLKAHNELLSTSANDNCVALYPNS